MFPQNSCVEALTLRGMVLEGGTLERQLGHEGRVLIMGLVSLQEDTRVFASSVSAVGHGRLY